MCRTISAISVASLLLGFASGQAQAQQPSLDNRARAAIVGEQIHLNDSDASLAAINQIIQELIAENARLAQHQRDIDAYLKACGDQPGCTQPVTSGHR